MGTNKRYAASVDRQIDQRILERLVATSGPLQSLTPEEIGLDTEPVTIDPQPKPVRAWVRFGGSPAFVEAKAHRWTPDAVAIQFEIAGKPYRAWVWASAVTPLPRG